MSFKIRTDASGNGQFTIDSTDVLSINTDTTVSLPTGTANGVAYLNGSKVLTSGSALVFDGSNLGIGTASPSSKLHVVNSTDNSTITLQSSASNKRGILTLVGVPSATGYSLGMIFGQTSDQSNYAYIDFERAGTATSSQIKFATFSGTTENTMTLDSSGNLGIGTASPQAKFVVSDSSNRTLEFGYSSGISANYMQSLNRGGTGDIDFAWYMASAGNWRWYCGSVEKMRLDSSGNLLVGCTAKPSATVRGAGFIPDDTGTDLYISSEDTESNRIAWFYNPNGLVGGIVTTGSSTAYSTSSDYRLKEDYQPVADAITRLNQLKPINFAWKVDGSRCDGFLAHELQEVIPEAAIGTKDETKIEEYEVTPAIKDEEGNVITEAVMGEREVPVYQGIDQSKIVPLLTAALQEAVAKIESLTQRIEALEAKGEQ